MKHSSFVSPCTLAVAAAGLALAAVSACCPIRSSAESAALAPKGEAGGTGAAVTGPATGVGTMETLMGEWTLTNLNGQAIESMLPADMKRPTLTFGKDGTVSGFAGVNRISAKTDAAALANGKVDFATIISKKMAGPEPAMKVEQAFVSTLSRCKFVEPVSPTSMRMTDGAATLMTFSKAGK